MTRVDDVRAVLSRSGEPPSLAGVTGALNRSPGTEQPRGVDQVARAAPVVRAQLIGLGPLQSLAEEPGVTDILVNGGGEVWTDSGAGLRRRELMLAPESAVRALAVRLAAVSGRRLDDAHPWVDAQLPGGIRVHAVLPPVAVDGTCISLRIPGRGWTLAELVRAGALPSRWLEICRAIVRARVNFLVSGATGTGKTSVLAALLAARVPGERLVVVEDTAELAVAGSHVVRVQARQANTEGVGGVLMADLVRQALRMRPDRIAVGECRGREVTDLLTALNTGHCGCGTVHANGAAEVPSRLEALGLLAGIPRSAIQAQVAAGLQVLIHLGRSAEHGRRLESVAVLAPRPSGLQVWPALTWPDGREPAAAEGWPGLASLIGWTGEAP